MHILIILLLLYSWCNAFMAGMIYKSFEKEKEESFPWMCVFLLIGMLFGSALYLISLIDDKTEDVRSHYRSIIKIHIGMFDNISKNKYDLLRESYNRHVEQIKGEISKEQEKRCRRYIRQFEMLEKRFKNKNIQPK